MSFRAAPVCTGVPASITISPSGPIQGCAGSIRLLQLSAIPSGTFTVQWEKSINNGPWTIVSPGGTGIGYYAQIVSGFDFKYRAIVSCTALGQSVTSNEVSLTAVNDPTYASLPYAMDFENNWVDHCSTNDAPDEHWTNELPMGSFSWRRDDQGLSAGWTQDVPVNYFYPPFSSGNHCARAHTSKGPGAGSLMLHLDCSGAGDKELRFDFKCNDYSPTLEVLVSADGGVSYLSLATINGTGVNATWLPHVIQLPSTSPNTIVKFKATSLGSQSGDFDMGIDNITVYPACTGKPTAGTVDSGSACLGEGISLSVNGSSPMSALSWLWQQTTNGISWNDVPGGNVENPTTPLTGPTWYRCIVTCTNSGESDTTEPRLINPNPVYSCYCNSGSTVANPQLNLGNVKVLTEPDGVTLLDNGNPLPATANLEAKKHYTNYTHLAPIDLYRDSSYKLGLTFFTNNGTNVSPIMGGAYIKAWIDYDRNGTFDNNEQIMGHQKASMVFVDSALFTVPSTAVSGITGMRIVTNNIYDSNLVTPCGPYGYGETEDYLVQLWEMPCNGNAAGGTVTASDSLSCPGYPVTLIHAGYDTTSGQVTRVWQHSANGTTWNDIAGTENQNVLNQIFTDKEWYRVRTACAVTASETYSDVVLIGKSNACYCVSYADGGFAGMADSSDIGGFSFYSLNFPLTGGHLNNPESIRKYTSHTYRTPLEMYADSIYNFTIDHTILRNDHADAKITLFIDYNANGTYDIPEERVYTEISGSSTWHKTGSITIPSNVTLGTETGMRLIINNDIAANIPSDEACGIYSSGETEDYRVIFKNEVVAVTDLAKGKNEIRISPNPSNGRISVHYNGIGLKEATLKVLTITGQSLQEQRLPVLNDGQTILLDLSEYAKGIYFINLEAGEKKTNGKVVIH